MKKSVKKFLKAVIKGEKLELNVSGEWQTLTDEGALRHLGNYCNKVTDRKPIKDALRIKGKSIHGAEKNALGIGVRYWVPYPQHNDWAIEYGWDGDAADRMNLERGLVHLNKESAIAHAKAMVGEG